MSPDSADRTSVTSGVGADNNDSNSISERGGSGIAGEGKHIVLTSNSINFEFEEKGATCYSGQPEIRDRQPFSASQRRLVCDKAGNDESR